MTESRCFSLSSTQQSVWLDQLLSPDIPSYNIGVTVQIDGAVDFAVFAAALRFVVGQHDALRLMVSGTVPRAASSHSTSLSSRCASASGKVQTIEQRPSAHGRKASGPVGRKRCQQVCACARSVRRLAPATAR